MTPRDRWRRHCIRALSRYAILIRHVHRHTTSCRGTPTCVPKCRQIGCIFQLPEAHCHSDGASAAPPKSGTLTSPTTRQNPSLLPDRRTRGGGVRRGEGSDLEHRQETMYVLFLSTLPARESVNEEKMFRGCYLLPPPSRKIACVVSKTSLVYIHHGVTKVASAN